MKKFSKIIVLILALAVALAVGLIAVSAADNGTEVTLVLEGKGSSTVTLDKMPNVNEYIEYKHEGWRASYRVKSVSGSTVTLDFSDARYFSVIDASGNESFVTKATLGNPATTDALLLELSKQINLAFKNAANGTTIKLYADVKDRANSSISVSVNMGFDLNGFNFVSTNEENAGGAKSAFGVGAVDFYLYSSRSGGSLFHGAPYASITSTTDPDTQVTTNTVNVLASRGYAAFSSSSTGRIFLGKYGDIDGDNLTIYSNMLANLTGSRSDGSYSMSIDGGYYYKWCNTYMTGMIYFRDNKDLLDGELNVSIKNATMYSEDYLFYYYHGAGEPIENSVKTFKLDIDNCVLKCTNSIFNVLNHFTERVDINLSNSYILSNVGSTTSLNLGEGCRFSGYSVNMGELVPAKCLVSKQFTFKFNKFNFTDYEIYETEDSKGNPILAVSSKFDPANFDVTENQTELFFTTTTAKLENTSLITWINEKGEVTQERWLNGETPRPDDALPEGTDAYYYTYGKIDAANGDRIYVAKPIARFGLKINLTLSDDLIYNVYVPESAIEGIKEVRVKNSAGDSKVLERGEMATINDVPYYRYYFNIKAAAAADAFSFDMDIYTDSTKGEFFTQKNEMSIPSYAAPIIYNNKYSDATHDLMNKVLAYVKAACDYFETSSNNKYYSVIGKIESVKAPTYRAGEARPSIPDESDVKGVLAGISVIFGSQLKYRYYLNGSTDFTANTVKISHVVNGNVQIDEITAEKLGTDDYGKYFDVPLRASDMRSDVIFTVNDDSYTYNLSNYIFKVNQGSDNNAKQLVYSLWDYSEAAGRFKNEMPEIDVTIDGTPISEYKLVANTEAEIAAAETFKSVISEEYGIELEILSSFDGKAIEFVSVSPESRYDYKATLEGEKLVVRCAYRSFFESATDMFVNDVFTNLNRDLDIGAGYEREYFYGKILYSDFDVPTYNGTAEDFNGKTAAEIDASAPENAFFAIKLAHDVANSKGYSVYADKGATYFIGTSKDSALGKVYSITIKTDTYWQGSDFIINDSSLSRLAGSSNDDVAKTALFIVSNDHASISVSPSLLLDSDENGNRPLYTTDKKLKAGLGFDAMLFVTNANLRQYIRFGYDTKQGKSQQELILIDEEGNIDSTTPLLFDFETVTSISAYRADTKPIVIDGGEGCTMTTLSSQVILHSTSSTISRNISVERSNTTVKNIAHVIYNEPTPYNADNTATGGHSYTGFFGATLATNITFEDCVVQARHKCKEGTYDLSVSNANNVVYRNVNQSNMFLPGTETLDTTNNWWVMGSNYCKNLTYDSCAVSRFDAHAGVYNATIKNSKLRSIRLTGGGTFTLEDTTVYQPSGGSGFIELREDYGSTWRGTLILKNVCYSANSVSSAFSIIKGTWEHHEFGYDTALPNVVIDNLTFSNNIKSTVKDIYVFNITNGVQKEYKYFVTETLTYDGKVQTVDKQIVDVFDDATLTALQALDDLSKESFEGTISRTITYTVTDSNGAKHNITETETINGFENVNPYEAPEKITFKNMSGSYNCYVSSKFSTWFENTRLILNPKDYNDNADTPILPLIY